MPMSLFSDAQFIFSIEKYIPCIELPIASVIRQLTRYCSIMRKVKNLKTFEGSKLGLSIVNLVFSKLLVVEFRSRQVGLDIWQMCLKLRACMCKAINWFFVHAPGQEIRLFKVITY